jgi:hypothetical protein
MSAIGFFLSPVFSAIAVFFAFFCFLAESYWAGMILLALAWVLFWVWRTNE